MRRPRGLQPGSLRDLSCSLASLPHCGRCFTLPRRYHSPGGMILGMPPILNIAPVIRAYAGSQMWLDSSGCTPSARVAPGEPLSLGDPGAPLHATSRYCRNLLQSGILCKTLAATSQAAPRAARGGHSRGALAAEGAGRPAVGGCPHHPAGNMRPQGP
jgi:hypothetical protein